MRYTRIQTEEGPRYAVLEDRPGGPWLTRILPPFPESRSKDESAPSFVPMNMRDAALLPPVEPSKIICVGRNYREHAAELGNEVPKEPLLFFKPPSSLLGPAGTILYPSQSKRVDFEGEFAIVIGRQARHIREDEDVRQYIRGYTIVNDVTARDLQKTDGQWTRAKGFDTFCAVGPIVTDEVDPLSTGLAVETTLNGEKKQQGNTDELIFDIPHLLRYITSFLTLEPGDLIPTGTPAGVGPMQPGDHVEVTISGIGSLANRVAAAHDGDRHP